MTRKMLTSAMVVAAMLLSLLSVGALTDNADAQGSPTCDYDVAEYVRSDGRFGSLRGVVEVTVSGTDVVSAVTNQGFTIPCNAAQAYPGPFTNMPTAPGGPYGFGSANPVAGAGAAAAPAAAAGGTGGGLAHTGSESTVLGYVGTGLIAFGAVALGSRRKFFQGALQD